MNNKKIIAVAVSGLMALSPCTAYAKGRPQKEVPQVKSAVVVNNGTTNKQANEQNRESKSQEIQTFKSQMRDKHKTMAQLRQETIALRQQIESKTEQLDSIIKDIESGNKTLSQDLLTELLGMAGNISGDTTEVKNTVKINDEVSDVQGKVERKDFNNALNSMDKVIAKLQARLDALTKLNKDLDDALAIANQATVPAPATAPSTPTTPTTTTTQDNTQTPADTQTTSGSTTQTVNQ